MILKSNTIIITTKIISSLSTQLLVISIIFLSALLLFSTTETTLNTLHKTQKLVKSCITTTNTATKITNPKWLEPISKSLSNNNNNKHPLPKQLNIALVDTDPKALERLETLHKHKNIHITKFKFDKISPKIKWENIYPLWIDENEINSTTSCPNIPMPNINEYNENIKFDIIVVNNIPCGKNWLHEQRVGIRDVNRLQVSLVAAKVAVERGGKVVHVVVVGGDGCEPMVEIFKCDDLVWREGEYSIYKPNVKSFKENILLPIGACEVAWQPLEKPLQKSGATDESSSLAIRRRMNSKNRTKKEAYVTLLHSSELYVCGAITLAQSILRTNTTKDLILLADETAISARSMNGLRLAGWKIVPIKRVRCSSAKKGHYNEWNCSKLRIWQLTNYTKLIFIDADFIVLKNIDHFFNYPQLSAAGDAMSMFNSGFMIIEPSRCLFETLMAKREKLISYNGGDQGLLNEVFTWWHRITKKVNFLKLFMDKEEGLREVPNDVYMIHFVGVKPWACYRDYDCNWDQIDRQIFASDQVHNKWWQVYDALPYELKPFCGLTKVMNYNIQYWRNVAKNNVNFSDVHWKIDVKDPRMFNLLD